MKSFADLGKVCGGLGALIVFWGVFTVLGWFPVQSSWQSVLLIGLGVMLLGAGLAVAFFTGLAEMIAEKRANQPRE